MASSSPDCGICDLRNTTKPSVIWCSECDGGLCLDCKEHHSLSTVTQKHSTIPIEDYLKLPSYIKECCSEHDEKFQLFCKTHDIPCCRHCILGAHKQCEDIIPLETFMNNFKSSNPFQETEQLINEILVTINRIRKDRDDNSVSILIQRKIIEDEIKEARKKLNHHLDKLQDNLLIELSEVDKMVTTQTSEVLKSLEENAKQLIGYQTNTSALKQYALDFQTFLAMKQKERDVASNYTSILSLLKSDSMLTTILHCKINSVVQNFSTYIPTFGEIVVKSQPSQLKIDRKRDTQAQVMVDSPLSRSIEYIALTLQQTIYTGGRDIKGCQLLPDGRLVFSDYGYNQSRVRSINKCGSENFRTGKIESLTFNMAYIVDTNTIAVTSGGGDTQCINIIDATSGQIQKIITVNSRCDGILYRNNASIYCARSKGLRMMTLSGNYLTDIIASQMSVHSYVATFRDKLYFTNKDTHTVTCCDLQGNTQWQFKDESILRNPLGIAVDNNGKVLSPPMDDDISNFCLESTDLRDHKNYSLTSLQISCWSQIRSGLPFYSKPRNFMNI